MTRRRIIAASALAFAAGLTTLGPSAVADEGPFGPIHVAANRHQYSGKGCPIEVVYTASINLAPHKGLAFNYHWERSDGAKTSVVVVRPPAGQRTVVVREKWRIGARGKDYDAGVTLFVNSGNTHLSEPSPVVRIHCT
ncbi:MAG: hypothetical protein ACXWG8_06720 [Usitatibacter sp.]